AADVEPVEAGRRGEPVEEISRHRAAPPADLGLVEIAARPALLGGLAHGAPSGGGRSPVRSFQVRAWPLPISLPRPCRDARPTRQQRPNSAAAARSAFACGGALPRDPRARRSSSSRGAGAVTRNFRCPHLRGTGRRGPI